MLNPYNNCMFIVERDLLSKHANLAIGFNFVHMQTLSPCMQFKIVVHLEIGVILGFGRLLHKSSHYK